MLALQMVIYSYSILVLLFLLLDSKKNRDLYSKTPYWFRKIIYATMLILFLEAITLAVDGQTGEAMYWAAYVFEFDVIHGKPGSAEPLARISG